MSDPHGIPWIVWIIVFIIAILVVIKGGQKAIQGGRRNIKDRVSDVCTTFAHSLSPLWTFLKNPFLQILAAVGVLLSGVLGAVGLLLNGVLGLLGNILSFLGLGGLVHKFDGLGLDKIVEKLVGKQKE
ncbi:hypothetical protein BGW37DRAFT_522148 [Umbelopsis sp. PMI_123]|nr:hypothetical protein BGW37DRAFT_522148 [Umbelopsis sp. PMI_123]